MALLDHGGHGATILLSHACGNIGLTFILRPEWVREAHLMLHRAPSSDTCAIEEPGPVWMA